MEEKKMTDKELKKAFFILRHGSDEGLSEYVKAVLAIENEYNRQKAEIERLEKDVHDMSWIIKIHKYCVGANHCQNRSDGEFELQKQVDKAWFEVGKMCMEERKDTAKEILNDIITGFVFGWEADNEDYRNGYEQALTDYDEKIKSYIKEKYGVEVEE